MGAMSGMAINFEQDQRTRRRRRAGRTLEERGFMSTAVGQAGGAAAIEAARGAADDLKKRRQGAGRVATDVVRPTGRPLGGGFLGY